MITSHNTEAATMLCGVNTTLVGKPLSSVLSVDTEGDIATRLRELLMEDPGGSVRFEGRSVPLEGRERWIRVGGRRLNLRALRLISLRLKDIHDSLAREAQCLALWARLAAEDDPVVVVIDVDRFRAFNESHGYACGDQLLHAVETRLAAVFGPDALIGRTGDDEFTTILPSSALEQARSLANAALDAIEAPVGTRKLTMTASAGIGHTHGGNGQEALSRACQALRRARLDGGARVRARVE